MHHGSRLRPGAVVRQGLGLPRRERRHGHTAGRRSGSGLWDVHVSSPGSGRNRRSTWVAAVRRVLRVPPGALHSAPIHAEGSLSGLRQGRQRHSTGPALRCVRHDRLSVRRRGSGVLRLRRPGTEARVPGCGTLGPVALHLRCGKLELLHLRHIAIVLPDLFDCTVGKRPSADAPRVCLPERTRSRPKQT